MAAESSPKKFFKRSSGQMKAVVEDAQEILEATRVMVETLTSNPPPALSVEPPPLPTKPRSRFDSDATGRYILINTPEDGFQVLKGEKKDDE